MKKLVKFLLPFVVASSAIFSGCDKNKNKEDNRVLLSFGDMHATATREIDVAKLAELTKANENFLFVVSTNSCGCWDDFEPVLNQYLVSNKGVCYRIDFNNFKDAAVTYGLANVSSSTTTFAIFENGKVKTSLCTADDKNIMYDATKFNKYMDETVIKPGCYFITKDDVSTIKNSGQSAVIYFERSACGDCSTLNPGLLRTYVKDHGNSNKVYVLDCQEYWRNKNASDYQSYLDFKDEMGMSAKNNPTYGYTMFPEDPEKKTNGVFPYFSYIENGEYASGCVIYNDSIAKQDGKYVVVESYYTPERANSLQYTNKVIKGLELTADDVYDTSSYVMWKSESADTYYKEILNSFLNYALPKQTFNF